MLASVASRGLATRSFTAGRGPVSRAASSASMSRSPSMAAAAAVAGAALAAWALSGDDENEMKLPSMSSWSLPTLLPAVAAAGVPAEGLPGTYQERSFIAIKPDGVQRGLVAEIIKRFEAKGYKLVAMKLVQPTQAFAEQHYADLNKRPFFPSLVKYFSSGPVVAMVWEGKNVIVNGRKIIGATNPDAAEPGSIRGDLCVQTGRNIIHGSDSPDAAKHEIGLWFKPEELVNYESCASSWLWEGK